MKDHKRQIIIYDPCIGHAGTLLGAMAAASDRPIHFIGTEPNSANWLRPDRSRYDVLHELYRGCVGQKYHATFEIFQIGAEVVDGLPAFQRYRGLIDAVITSPPYYCAEMYSRELTQSAIKFRTYPDWREGFLRKTLRTCADYLRPGGRVLWNIADISINGKFFPLEKDSVDAMLEYDLVFEEKLKMPLSHEPGGTIGASGLPKMKNFAVYNGVHHKYEPVFVFRKPERG
jgi:hypothetical protein